MKLRRSSALASLAALSICLTGCDEIIGGIIYLVYLGFAVAVGMVSLAGLVFALIAVTKRQRALVTFVLSIPFAAIGVGTHLWITNGFAPAKASIEQAYLPIVLAMGMPIVWLVAGFVAFMFSPPAPEPIAMDPAMPYRQPQRAMMPPPPPLSKERLGWVIGGSTVFFLAYVLLVGLSLRRGLQPSPTHELPQPGWQPAPVAAPSR